MTSAMECYPKEKLCIFLLKGGGRQGHSAEASHSASGMKNSLCLKTHCALSSAASGSGFGSLLGVWESSLACQFHDFYKMNPCKGSFFSVCLGPCENQDVQ